MATQVKNVEASDRREGDTVETWVTAVARHREQGRPDPEDPCRHPPGHPARRASRVTTTDGRSPGSRVAALSPSSRARLPSDMVAEGSPLTVAGQPRSRCLQHLTAFPFDPRREPSSHWYFRVLSRVNEIGGRVLRPSCGALATGQRPTDPLNTIHIMVKTLST